MVDDSIILDHNDAAVMIVRVKECGDNDDNSNDSENTPQNNNY